MPISPLDLILIAPPSGLTALGAVTLGTDGAKVRQFKKELIRVGSFKINQGERTLDVTLEDLNSWAQQFDAMKLAGHKVSIPATHEAHGDPKKNQGWVDSMFVEDDRLFGVLGAGAREKILELRFGDRLYKLGQILALDDLDLVYLSLISHWENPAWVVLNGLELPTPLTRRSSWLECLDSTHRMMYLDMVTYLPDDILVKMDRASMGVSLEAREPLLDHRVVEFSWRIPLSMKGRHGKGKWLLRQVLYKYVPKELVDRPKMGFGIPLNTWLRGPLREWAEALLDEARLKREGFFNPGPIRAKWNEHVTGVHDWQYLLWDVLMFQAWLERWHQGNHASSS